MFHSSWNIETDFEKTNLPAVTVVSTEVLWEVQQGPGGLT